MKRAWIAIGVLALAAACSKDATAPPDPVRLEPPAARADTSFFRPIAPSNRAVWSMTGK